MITYLIGNIEELLPTKLTIQVNNIGYEVLIPFSSFQSLDNIDDKKQTKLLIHQVIRETEHLLFGFITESEKALFKLLIDNVSGVGPKVALAILSGISVAEFKSAIITGDTIRLSKISGVGKKTSERIVLELKDKVGVAETWKEQENTPTQENQALLALIGLGYKREESKKAIEAAKKENIEGISELEELIKGAIKKLI